MDFDLYTELANDYFQGINLGTQWQAKQFYIACVNDACDSSLDAIASREESLTSLFM